MFDEKLKLEGKKSQIEKNGTVWLEPMREIRKLRLAGAKVARTKMSAMIWPSWQKLSARTSF